MIKMNLDNEFEKALKQLKKTQEKQHKELLKQKETKYEKDND